MYQKITLLGNSSQVEEKRNAKGNLFLRFGLAVQTSAQGPTTWHNCIVSGPFAETMKDKLAKGQKLFVEGTPTQRKDPKTNITYHNVMVETCRIVHDPNRVKPADANTPAPQQQASQGSIPDSPSNNGDNFDDDIPF